MSQYEMMVIFKPQLLADDNKAPLENLEKLIKQAGGSISSTDDWGEKSMTFAISGHERGYYVVYRLEMDGGKVDGFRQKMNLNKDALRWVLVDAENMAEATEAEEAKK